jgi:hypothetical protein
LPNDLIIGERKSLRFAPGLETLSQAPSPLGSEKASSKLKKPFPLSLITNKVSFIAPTGSRQKQLKEGLHSLRYEKENFFFYFLYSKKTTGKPIYAYPLVFFFFFSPRHERMKKLE